MRIDTFQVNVLHYLFGVPVTTFIFRRTKTVTVRTKILVKKKNILYIVCFSFSCKALCDSENAL